MYLSNEEKNKSKIVYSHKNKHSFSTAYEKDEEAIIYLEIPRRLGALDVSLNFFDESNKHLFVLDGELDRRSEDLEIYRFDLNLQVLETGLYFFRPELEIPNSTLYGHKVGQSIYFCIEAGLTQLFQLTICDFLNPTPHSLYGRTIYHVFVDRFRRGGDCKAKGGSRLISGDWETIPEYPAYLGAPLKNNTFYGGTLYGIIEKLDYIKSLGVGAIYLSPIFDSPSNHKYDTSDYMQVDSAFGGDEALKKLIECCKEKDILVILDGVFNHTGADSVYFNRYSTYSELGAYQSKSSPYYAWYDFKSYPDEYTSWWGIEILPRINPDEPSCKNYFVGERGVIEKYMDLGIYGFRLDVADELSDDFIASIKNKMSEKHENILYGEVWEDASNKIAYEKRKRYYLGKELDGVMNYPLRTGLIDYVCGRGTESLNYALTDIINNCPERVLHAQMNFLGTHDTERILTVIGGESSEGKTNDELSVKRMTENARELAICKLKGLYTVLATLPGIPTVFYGDEAGLEGYSDPFNRMPYPWGKEDLGLIEHYRTVGKIRSEHSVYTLGSFRLLSLTDEQLIFERIEDDGRIYVTVFNNSDSPLEVFFEEEAESLFNKETNNKHKVSAFSADIYIGKTDTFLKTRKGNAI